MPRVLRVARSVAVLCVLCAAACGTDSPPAAPTLQLPFTSSAASPVLFNGTQGVPVATTGYFAFGLLNAGTNNLVVQQVSYSGDPAMALQALTLALPATLDFNGELVIGLTCTPPGQDNYDGLVSIVSNAANTPDAGVYLTCEGVP